MFRIAIALQRIFPLVVCLEYIFLSEQLFNLSLEHLIFIFELLNYKLQVSDVACCFP